MSSPAPHLGSPPTQQKRSAATRLRLLDATIEVLSELGYARTSTPEICRRAGVSQGALFKHFPSKTILLGAAVRHLFASLVADFAAAFDRISERRDRVGAAVPLLWETFNEPGLQVAFELYTAARTDADLRTALAPVLDEHRKNLRAQARRLFPEAARDPGFEDAVDTILAAMQGLALLRGVYPDADSGEAPLSFIVGLARAVLEPTQEGGE